MLFPKIMNNAQGCPLLPFLFNFVLVVPSQGNLGRKKKKVSILDRKKYNYLYLANDRILYIENPREYTKN